MTQCNVTINEVYSINEKLTKKNARNHL